VVCRGGLIRAVPVMLILTLMTLQYVVVGGYTTDYTYKLSPDGYASVTVVVSGVEGYYVIYVSVDGSALRDSIIAINDAGEVLPVRLINETVVAVYTANTSRSVVLTYIALTSTQTPGYFEALVSPSGPAKVVLPTGAALLYFNGSAEVAFVDNTITLTYSSGGRYLITFILPQATTASATPIPIQTNTSPSTTPQTQSPTSPSPPQQTPEVQPGNWLPYITTALVVAAVAFTLILLRRGRGGGSVSVGGGFATGGDIDERDVEILKALRGGRTTISGLARKLNLSKSVVWRRVKKLSELGLVSSVSEGDRTYITLTKAGEDLLSKRGEG